MLNEKEINTQKANNDKNNNNSIQFIYLRAWQHMANYSQAQKQQYRLTLKNKTKT
jgi:hypothetical protein